LEEFFTTCFENGEIPTVEKMGLAVGVDRRTLYKWEHGHEGSTPTRAKMISHARDLMASFDAEMVMEGKVNPVTYIFRAKNFYGMVDKQEHILTPNNPLGDYKSADEIQHRLVEGI